MAGRKRKPAQLRLVEGKRGHRPILVPPTTAVLNVTARKQVGDAPEWLDRQGKATWRRLVLIKGLSWLETVDREVLTAFCQSYSAMVAATKRIAADGLTVIGAQGGMVSHPANAVFGRAARLVGSLGSDLGLTPAGRMRLGQRAEKPKGAEEIPAELAGDANAAGA